MIGLIRLFLLYPIISKLRLWGAVIYLSEFSRRGFLFGYFSALIMGGVSTVIFFISDTLLYYLVSLGLPNFLYLTLSIIYIIPVVCCFALIPEFFTLGLRAPNQPLFGNLFWSENHEEKWLEHRAWLEDQKNGA